MNLNQNTIQESKKILQEMKETENLDISTRIAEVEGEILLTFEEFEKHRRLRHTREVNELFNRLEVLYLAQSEPRRTQIKRVEELKVQLRILHQPYVDRWVKNLFDDHTELFSKKTVVGNKNDKFFDKESGLPMLEVSHNLRDVATGSKKILEAIKNLRDNLDCLSISELEGIFQKGHEGVNMKLRTEKVITDVRGLEDLLSSIKEEKPRLDELTSPELVATASAEKMISVLESLKQNF